MLKLYQSYHEYKYYRQEVFNIKKQFTILLVLLLSMAMSACSRDLTSNVEFETMLSRIYASIEEDGTLNHQISSNIDVTKTNILDAVLFDVLAEDIALEMIHGAHICHISPSKIMTHRCLVKVFFEGTPLNTSQLNTEGPLFLVLEIILDGKMVEDVLVFDDLRYNQMEIITEDYGSYARTENYITKQKNAIDIVLKQDRNYKNGMDAAHMERAGYTHFEFNEYGVKGIQSFLTAQTK